MAQSDEILRTLQTQGAELIEGVALERAQYKRTSIKVIIALIVSGLVSVCSLALAGVLIYQTDKAEDNQQRIIQAQAESKERGLILKSLLNEMQSCTTPEGACNQRNQAATQAAIARLVAENQRSMSVIVKCARSTSTDAEHDACVVARLKEGAP